MSDETRVVDVYRRDAVLLDDRDETITVSVGREEPSEEMTFRVEVWRTSEDG